MPLLFRSVMWHKLVVINQCCNSSQAVQEQCQLTGVCMCVLVCVCVWVGGWVCTHVSVHLLSWHSSLSAWPLKMGWTDCPKMSVNNYKQMLHNCPQQQRPQKQICSPNGMCNKQMRISNTVGLKLNMIKYVKGGVIVQPKDTWSTSDWKRMTRGRTKNKLEKNINSFCTHFAKWS